MTGRYNVHGEYEDIGDELDESLDFMKSSARPISVESLGSTWLQKDKAKKILMEELLKTTRPEKSYGFGNRKYYWEMKLPEALPVAGYMVLPDEAARHPDIAMKSIFERLFKQVKWDYEGDGCFTARLEDKKLGAFRVPYQDVEPRRNHYGERLSWKGSYDDERQASMLAERWLRQNLHLTVKDGNESFPTYSREWPRKAGKQSVSDYRKLLADAGRTITAPPKPEAVNVASLGINTNRLGTNLAFVTQLTNTAKASSLNSQFVDTATAGKVIG